MLNITLEERVALLEQEILQMKRQMSRPQPVPWWEQISGAFADTPAFDEATKLGREYREAQRTSVSEDGDVSA
jgi:hypothetical protein